MPRNHRRNLLDNVAIWLFCGLLIAATLFARKQSDDWDDDLDDLWPASNPPIKIIDPAEPIEDNHRLGIYSI